MQELTTATHTVCWARAKQLHTVLAWRNKTKTHSSEEAQMVIGLSASFRCTASQSGRRDTEPDLVNDIDGYEAVIALLDEYIEKVKKTKTR